MNKIVYLKNYLERIGHLKEAELISNIIKLSSSDLFVDNIELEEEIRAAFQKNLHLRQEYIPSKIRAIPGALTAFAAGRGRPDAIFKSNSATRNLEKAIAGGGDRLSGTLHGIGFAHDLLINTGLFKEEYRKSKNADVIKADPEIIFIMRNFAESNNLVWGGSWDIGGRVSVTNPKTKRTIDVGIGELHHFELPRSEYEANIPPFFRKLMIHFGMQPSEIGNAGSRLILYKELYNVVARKSRLSPQKTIGPSQPSPWSRPKGDPMYQTPTK